MVYVIKSIVALLIPLIMHSGAIGLVSTTPQETVDDFMTGITTQQTHVADKYMDNAYVNMIGSIEGDEEVVKRIDEAMFSGFSYEIDKIAVKEGSGVAVARVTVKNYDFSNVLAQYNAAAHEYIMKNIHTEEIADKKALNDVCLELFTQEMEKAVATATEKEKKAEKDADSGAYVETTVLIPMVDDGYYGWNIVMSDEIMAAILGNLQLP